MAGITQAREARVRQMLAGRLGSVVVILEAVHRRHNASAILRSCECFGVHEVHLVTKGFKPSKGAARGSERWLEVNRWDSTDAVVEALRTRGFKIYVADLMEEVHSPDSLPIDGNVAILMGAELTGVSDRARELADGAICVPCTASRSPQRLGGCRVHPAEADRAEAGRDRRRGSSPGAPRPVL